MHCSDFTEAQVIKSFLEAQGFHPRLRDEQTRSVAPHFEQLLGKLTLEIPEVERQEANTLLEAQQQQQLTNSQEAETIDIDGLARKALWNAILGCTLVPVLCTLYSVYLILSTLRAQTPLGKPSRTRLLWAVAFNGLAIAAWVWLYFGFSEYRLKI